MNNETIFPPRVADNLDTFAQILNSGPVGLFSDFDGTLTPIFDDHRDTTLSPATRDTLSELSEKIELVAVVSGRSARVLREMVGLDNVTYVGNHGLEVWENGEEPDEGRAQISDGLLEDVAKGVRDLKIEGISVEDKSVSLAIHYRNASDTAEARSALSEMLNPLAVARGLKVREGKMILEIGPGAGMNKGAAVRMLARKFELTGAIVIGDDLTDCDAFDALRELIREGSMKGAAIVVVDEETPEIALRKADYRLNGVEKVEAFLRWMAHASPSAETKL